MTPIISQFEINNLFATKCRVYKQEIKLLHNEYNKTGPAITDTAEMFIAASHFTYVNTFMILQLKCIISC